jgi:hypothetical protein
MSRTEVQTRGMDITIPHNETDRDKLIIFFSTVADKWVFQLEKGEKTGYLHYQCRVNLKEKKRPCTFKSMLGRAIGHYNSRVSKTSTNVYKSGDVWYDYCSKENTREEGPWSDITQAEELRWAAAPSHLRIKEWYPWQKQIIDSIEQHDNDYINVLIDPDGMSGKSTVCNWLDYHKKANFLPPFDNYKEIMNWAHSLGITKAYVTDMPRALAGRALYNYFAAIETLKGGLSFDTRYVSDKTHFERPVMWIFCNEEPHVESLTRNRWKWWMIGQDRNLQVYNSTKQIDIRTIPNRSRVVLNIVENFER